MSPPASFLGILPSGAAAGVPLIPAAAIHPISSCQTRVEGLVQTWKTVFRLSPVLRMMFVSEDTSVSSVSSRAQPGNIPHN